MMSTKLVLKLNFSILSRYNLTKMHPNFFCFCERIEFDFFVYSHYILHFCMHLLLNCQQVENLSIMILFWKKQVMQEARLQIQYLSQKPFSNIYHFICFVVNENVPSSLAGWLEGLMDEWMHIRMG